MQTPSQPSKPETPPRRGRGRPPRLSREQIARAALELGLDKATVTALATHLGVDHSSLYRHVENRDAILALAAEMAVADLEWRGTMGAGWREDLIVITDAIWDLYEKNPGLAEAFRSMQVMPRSGIRSFAEAVARLQAYGFSLPDAVLAMDTLIDLAGDCFTGWQGLNRAGDAGETRLQRIINVWQDEAAANPAQATEIGGMIAVMQGTSRDWWEQKRDLVLDGLSLRCPAAGESQS